VMTLVARQAGHFEADDVGLLNHVGNQVGVAVENAGLYQQAQQEIAERRQAEEALAAERNLLRTLIDNLPDFIYVKDSESRFVAANTAVAHIMGAITPDELLGKTDFDFYPQDLATRYSADERKVMQSGEPLINQEEPGRDPAGNRRWLSTTKVPLRDDLGDVVGVVGIGRDITERRQLEEQLRQAQKMEAVGLLAGGIAHDFNNLLTAILGYANMLKLKAEPASFTHQAARSIEKAAERAAELTGQLLGFARRGKHQNIPVDLHQIIQEVTGLLSRTIDKNITITQRLRAKPAATRGDPGQMHQVMVNLAVNARDAMPEGGELTFETDLVHLDEEYCRSHVGALPGDYLMVSVADTGYGIAKENLDRIFDPFFTTKELGQETGMGLPMVYGIVKNHGGSIRVYSELGHGTTFRVYLPPGEGAITVTDAPESEPIRGTGRILLVDDEDMVRKLASAMLRALGYEVVTAANGKEAVDAYRDFGEKIDLVIIDMIMPQMGGRECFRQLKELDPDVRAILSTGYGLDDKAQQILDDGVQGFVQKPYHMQELAGVVGKIIATSE